MTVHFDGCFGNGNGLSLALLILLGLILCCHQTDSQLRNRCILGAVLCKQMKMSTSAFLMLLPSNLQVESNVALVMSDVHFSVNKPCI